MLDLSQIQAEMQPRLNTIKSIKDLLAPFGRVGGITFDANDKIQILTFEATHCSPELPEILSSNAAFQSLWTLNLIAYATLDIAPLAAIKTLEALNVACPKITNLKALAGLKTLTLSNAQVSSLEGIDAIVGLTHLDLSGMRADFTKEETNYLLGLWHLTFLDVSFNQLPDLKFLNSLPAIKQVNARGCGLTKFRDIINVGLGCTFTLNLQDNPFEEANTTYFKELLCQYPTITV